MISYIKYKIFLLSIILKNIFCGCGYEANHSGFEKNKGEYKIYSAGRLPSIINESSGLAVMNDSIILTHNDSGTRPEIFAVNRFSGNLVKTYSFNFPNRDWEDITKDEEDNIFIGDFGNNLNRRRNLKIYKIKLPDTSKVEQISFRYGDQQSFPPTKKDMNFDCEAMFWYNDSLHLFSKNRGKRIVKHYTLPSTGGNYVTQPDAFIKLSNQITAADINPEKKQFALLSYGKILLFEVSQGKPLFDKPYKCVRFGKGGQAEGLVYLNNNNILISNEIGKVFILKKGK